jgi:hypothetical protein
MLNMRISWHDGSRRFSRARQNDLLKIQRRRDRIEQRLSGEQPHVESDLIVPASTCVELRTCVADHVSERALYIHVDVLEPRVKGQRSRPDAVCYALQTVLDLLQLLIGYDTCARQGVRMRYRASYVVLP